MFHCSNGSWFRGWRLQVDNESIARTKLTLVYFGGFATVCSRLFRLGWIMTERETVVITGFGPFRGFMVNPSWEVAQGLKSAGLTKKIDVYIKQLPVNYVQCKQIVTDLWQTLHPKFVVHLGVARGSSIIMLEQRGKNSGYRDRDVCGFYPDTHCCIEGGPENLDSIVDMRKVSKVFRQAGKEVVSSRDAGRYLCDFTYYCSLYRGQRKAALVHVPSSGSLASTERLIPLLQALICRMLQQLENPSETA